MRPILVVSVGFFSSVSFAVPPAPLADPSGIPKSRYISMSVPSNGGEPMALRVTLVSLHHVIPPYGGGPSIPFTSFEGEIRWVGPPVIATENDNDPTPFVAAPLQCTPYYHDWSTLGLFHAYGDAVVPSSSYDVAALDQTCAGAEEGCAEVSAALSIPTARYGDVIAPFNPPSTTVQPNLFEDLPAIISKVSRTNGSASKAQMQITPNDLDPTRTVNILDVLWVTNSLPGVPYPFAPTSCDAPREDSSDSSAGNVSAALGAPTLKVFITPVPAQGTSSYPSGTQIVGQELIAPIGNFRAFFNVQFQDFNPANTDPFLRGWQIQIDAESMSGSNASPPTPGVDLVLAQEPCGSSNACRTVFAESGTVCLSSQCTAVFVSNTPSGGGAFPPHSDWIFLGLGNFAFGSAGSPTGPFFGGGGDYPGEEAMDDGSRKYVGTLILDIPPEAAGHMYTLNVRQGSETMAVAGRLVLVDQPIAQITPAVLKIGMESVGIDYNRTRFLSFVPGHSGESLAIRVKLVSLHHVDPPYTGGPSVPFTSFEGQYRWVGPPTQYVESTSTNVPFFASSLQCAPHYQDWNSAGYLHVTGSAIVPSSLYDVQFVPESCMGNEGSCTEISAPLTLATTRWGDVETPFNPPALSAQPDLGDISALVNKFRSAPGAPIKARALLIGDDAFGNIATLGIDLGFGHIAACVDAFRGKPYPHVGPEACE